MDKPDDCGEWDPGWEDQPLTDDQRKLRRLQAYVEELYNLNGTSLSWNAALKRITEIINE